MPHTPTPSVVPRARTKTRPGTPQTRVPNRLVRRATVLTVLAVAGLLGIVGGVLFAYSTDLPAISGLDSYVPETITRVHARGGELIGEYATKRRVVVGYDEIPDVLRHAIISAEDGDFFNHVGFNIPRAIATLVSNIRKGNLTAAGASTLTMQLARNVTLSGETLGQEKTWQRKLRELYYTIHIEKRYTKREIFTLYANQMWLGSTRHSAYGVEAASRLYFGKPAIELELGEAATIAGIIQTPSRQSPLVNIDLARQRRDYALGRMAAEGYITDAEAVAAIAQPIVLAERTVRSNDVAPYFIEEVRQHLEKEYGVDKLYEQGLTVHTTLDARLQAVANKAVADGLRAHDKRQGFRKPTRNVLAEAKAQDPEDTRNSQEILAAFDHSRWVFAMNPGDVVPAVVTSVDRELMHVRFGPYETTVLPRGQRLLESGAVVGIRGIGRTPANELVEPGDLIEVAITTLETVDADGDDLDEPLVAAELDQEPLAEAALIAIENRTGRILSMVGGFDFDRSKFNRATQAERQLGSLFKGVLYAAAIDQGYTTTTIVPDERATYDVGPNQEPYSPENYDHKYEGPITLRRAIEQSKNVPAVWLMNAVGPQTVVDFARQLGFRSNMPPFLSVALGSAESNLIDVTSAYAAFPNRGTRMIPYQIERITDRAGNVLEEGRPVPQDAIRPDTAYMMVSLMEGVVQRGTGRRALRLGWPLGGKTGTMDDYTDAWFVGFDPDITVGVWVGYDEKKTLGDGEQGSAVALPIWLDYMAAYVEGREPPPGFDTPSNIVFATVNEATGKPAARWSGATIREAFITGTEPGARF